MMTTAAPAAEKNAISTEGGFLYLLRRPPRRGPLRAAPGWTWPASSCAARRSGAKTGRTRTAPRGGSASSPATCGACIGRSWTRSTSAETGGIGGPTQGWLAGSFRSVRPVIRVVAVFTVRPTERGRHDFGILRRVGYRPQWVVVLSSYPPALRTSHVAASVLYEHVIHAGHAVRIVQPRDSDA
jgi:hypothetical protein